MKHKASGKRSLPVRPLSLERRSSLTVVSFWLALFIYFFSIVRLQCCRLYHVDWQAFWDVAHIVISSSAPTGIYLRNSQGCEEKQIFFFNPILMRRVGQCVCVRLHLATCCLCKRFCVCVLECIQQYMPVWMCVCVRVWTCMRVAMLECAALSCLLHSMWEGLLRGKPSVVFWRSTCCNMRLESVETQLVKSWHIMRQKGVKAGKRFRDKQLD